MADYTYEITPNLDVNIYRDGIWIVYQPHNPEKQVYSRFETHEEAEQWALAEIARRREYDEQPITG